MRPSQSLIQMAEKRKPEFAPLPPRAISDQRLTLTHFRVLAAIAQHDRMSVRRKAGQGCWASHRTLAELTGVNYNNLSTAISDLGLWGYLTRHSHPLNKRQHVYRVTYDSSPIGEQSKTREGVDSSPRDEQNGSIKPDDSSPTREVSDAKTPVEASPSDAKSTNTLRPEKNETQQDQLVGGVEYIPSKRKEILLKQEKSSVETAPLEGGDGLRNGKDDHDGKYLAIVEDSLREGSSLNSVDQHRIEEIFEARQPGDNLHHQAQRILETWGTPS